MAKERDERSRATYRRRIAQFSREQLLFIDESAKDERTFQVCCKEFATVVHMNHSSPLLYMQVKG